MREHKVVFVQPDRMRLGHAECLDDYNDTVSCGLDHGDCKQPRCCFSELYKGPPKTEAERAEHVAELKSYKYML